MKRLLLALALVALGATAAQADNKFDQMDTNKDGSVTWEEFQVAYPQMKREAFDAIDADKSGGISHDEWHKFLSGHQKNMGQGGGMGGSQGGMGGGMGGSQGGMGGGMGGGTSHPGSDKPMIMPPRSAQ